MKRSVAVWGTGRAHGTLLVPFLGGTGSMFISYNKATTSMGERLNQGSALRM